MYAETSSGDASVEVPVRGCRPVPGGRIASASRGKGFGHEWTRGDLDSKGFGTYPNCSLKDPLRARRFHPGSMHSANRPVAPRAVFNRQVRSPIWAWLISPIAGNHDTQALRGDNSRSCLPERAQPRGLFFGAETARDQLTRAGRGYGQVVEEKSLS